MTAVCRIATWGFGLAYLAALALFLVGTFGLFGSPQGPLSGVFLIPLGLPWNQLIDWAHDPVRPVLAAAAPLLNLLILLALCARMHPSGH